MFKWIQRLCKSSADTNEVKIRDVFDFLLVDYGFSFAKVELGNLVDKNGKLIFYGPLNAYQIYNSDVCINILHLVQRNDYTIYITDTYSTDQQYICNGCELPSYLAYDFPKLACEIKSEISRSKTVFGKKLQNT